MQYITAKFIFGDVDWGSMFAPRIVCRKCALAGNQDIYDCCPVMGRFLHSDEVIPMRCYNAGWCIRCAQNYCLVPTDKDTMARRLNMWKTSRSLVKNCQYNHGR